MFYYSANPGSQVAVRVIASSNIVAIAVSTLESTVERALSVSLQN